MEEATSDPSFEFSMGMKQVSRYVHGNKRSKKCISVEQVSMKENITVVFTFSADGKTYCPKIVS
jgi:hypothetical protein